MIAAHPQLARTLAEHGLTLDAASGEVVELEPFDTVMSKRSAQIKRNLERLEAEWEQAHPGEELGPVMTARLQGIAWTHQRPGKKPADLKNEAWWVQELREAGYDPARSERRVAQPAVSVDELSVQEVASRALDRSAAGASAWTRHAIQEHVTRITTEHGVQAEAAELREFITLAAELAVSDCFSLLPPGSATPEHVAHLTSLNVVAAEAALRDQLAAATPQREPEHPDVTEAAKTAGLDEGQSVAAAAAASTDPLVVVEGAAGSGKTTMLRTAIAVAAEHGRVSRVVAPTKKAAQVAEEELGIPATSVAALVYAHGWRWNHDGVWTRLSVGDLDPDSGRNYTGPPKDARLARGMRVIVDEAGMLDQDTAHALLTVTAEAGVTVALVGDRAQLPAVGRGGALDMAAQIRGRTHDMTELHRFTDPDYAALTLTMRERETPGEVFDQLAAAGLVALHIDDENAREYIAEQVRNGEAIMAATNDEAAALNERVRTGRIESGAVDDAVTATGSDGLPIGRGDVIQTRKNDTALRVANRQQWVVQQVTDDGALYAREVGSGSKNPRTVTLPPEYVAEHAHLSYAATAYGVQGATVTTSHTILSEATSAAGIYVGMTRGRETNRLHVVAESMAEARAQFVEAMERDPADRGLDHATQQAVEAVRGLVADGPVRLVTEELASLDHEAELAQQQAERWAGIAARLDAQRDEHRAEDEQDNSAIHAAEDIAEQVRAEVAGPLVQQAEQDGAAYLAAVEDEAAASARLSTVGRFGRRKARAERQAAKEQTQTQRARVRDDWGGEPPRTRQALPGWAGRAAARKAEGDPRLSEAARAVEAARTGRGETSRRHKQERFALLARELGAEHARGDQYGMRTINPQRAARDTLARATLARAEADELRSLPINDAARCIEAKRAEQERTEREQWAARRARQLEPFERNDPRRDPGRDGPARSL